jgi:hypothetical protein
MAKKGKKGKKLHGKAKAAFLRRMAAGRRKAERSRSHGAREEAKKPKRSSGKRKQSPAQKTASLANLAKARRARKQAKAAGKKHPVSSYSYHRPPARVHVPKHMSYEHKQSPAQRRASLKNLQKARAARRRGASEETRKKGHGKRQRYAMSNPLGGVELLVGGFTGLLGFLGADFLDRVLATHALTDKGTKDANGVELYADNPPTSGSYTGLYNPTAIAAPMNALRWVAGLLVAIVPITIAQYVKSNVGRSTLQMFGFAAGLRVVGKGLIDLMAFLTKKTGFGQRLYDGEMRAAALKATGQGATPTVPLSSLPSAGLGGVPKQGLGCKCQEQQKPPPPAGTGWPSYPREVAQAGGQGGGGGGGQAQPPAAQQLPPPPPPPPMQAPPAPALEGVRPRNPYHWGAQRDAA